MTVTVRLPQLPPPDEVHAALRTITKRLAVEIAQPRGSAPDWSELEWRMARAVGDWGALPQGRRIVRALSGRTPRPWPLYNVRGALSQRH
jgi:hypothetical protein